MREIKFRAWDKKDKIMFYNVENTYDYGCKGDNNVPEDNFGEVLKDERYEVMQFTGLYDKNKVPIYEGDIVKKETPLKNSSYNFTIPQYAKVMWIEELAEYHLVNRRGKTLWTIGDEKYNIEVCGNIYENSDLLGE